jgi:hypothetical protein
VGVRDILRCDDPDIGFNNETLPGFEASRNYNLLTLPRISEFFQHPMGVVVVADTEEVCDRTLRLLKMEWKSAFGDADVSGLPWIRAPLCRFMPLFPSVPGISLHHKSRRYGQEPRRR